jgi:hypothetical protein
MSKLVFVFDQNYFNIQNVIPEWNINPNFPNATEE